MMRDWMGNWGEAPLGWGGESWMFLMWILVIAGLVGAVRWMVSRSCVDGHNQSALEILEGRYARGEIDKQNFEEKKSGLM